MTPKLSIDEILSIDPDFAVKVAMTETTANAALESADDADKQAAELRRLASEKTNEAAITRINALKKLATVRKFTSAIK